MKTNSTRIALYRLLIFIFLLLYTLLVFSQSRTFIELSATAKQDGVELKGLLMSSHTFDKITIERRGDDGEFYSISQLPVTNTTDLYSFKYTDNKAIKGDNFYQVRLTSTANRMQEISNILMIRKDDGELKDLKLLNTILQSNSPGVTLSSAFEAEASLEVTDMSGRIMSASKIRLQPGSTQCSLPNLEGKSGYFVLVVKTQKNSTRQKIIIQ